jgi:hypothetical protein
MRRREVIPLLGGAAAWRLVARTQRPARCLCLLFLLSSFVGIGCHRD